MMSWRRRVWRILATVTGLLFVALIVVVGLQIRKEQQLQLTAYRTGTWVLVAAEIELLRFQDALHRAVATPHEVSDDDLLLRFDLFWSRVPIILESDEAAGIRQIPNLVETFRAISAALPDWERRLIERRSDDSATLLGIASELGPHRDRIHDAVVKTLVNDQSVFHRESLADRLNQLALLFSLLFVVGTVLVVMLMRQLRQSERLANQAMAAEQAAETARTQLSDIIESVDSGITYVDRAGRIRFVNRGYTRLFPGLAHLAREGTLFSHILEMKQRLGVLTRRQDKAPAPVDASTVGSREFEEVLPDGRTLLVQERQTADGGVVTVRTDVTQLHNQRRELAMRLEAIEASSDGLLITNARGRITYISTSFTRILQIAEPAQIVGKSWRELASREQQDELMNSCAPALFSTGEWRGETVAITADGTPIPLEAYCKLLDSGDMVVAMRDLTEQRQQEMERIAITEQLFRAQKLDALGRMAGGVAHDFNNVLGAIMGYGALLAEDLPLDSEQRDFARRILSAGEHGRDLVQQILAFSRTDTSEMTPIPLRTIIDDTLDMVRSSIPVTTRLTVNLEQMTGRVFGNATHLSQIIINLCLNARDALGGRQGQISISSTRQQGLGRIGWDGASTEMRSDAIRLREGPEGGRIRLWLGRLLPERHYVCLQIDDNGLGMSRDVTERMLDPFFTTKPRGKGTGLGLATVHRIILDHQGGMAVDTTLGVGTSIRIYLPEYAATDNPEPAPLIAHKPLEGKGSLLVVDDEEAVGTQLGLRLERLGYEVIVLDDPADAVDAVREAPALFDAVITDLSMPQMSGLELATRLRQLVPDLPIYLCSGNTGDLTADDRELIAPERIFEKPVDFSRLAAALANDLSHSDRVG